MGGYKEIMKTNPARDLARRFHEAYEDLAPLFGYRTRRKSAVPWYKVPTKNKRLMIAVCERLLEHGIPTKEVKE